MASEIFKFTGARSSHYDNYLGPFLFEPYGKEMASRVPLNNIHSVLELAAGTGRVTRHLRARLPASVKLVATDLSPDMLSVAKEKFKDSAPVEFAVADMQNLPYESETFDVVVCQFGIMFPPDKPKVFSEVYRVLKPKGIFLFSTWEQTERVEILKLIYNDHVIPFFTGEDPARFLVPFSLNDPEALNQFLVKGRFKNTRIDRVVLVGIGPSAKDLVKGFFVTHAIGQEVADRDPEAFLSISQKMEEAIRKKFSDRPVTCELIAYFGSGVKE